ncbi:lipopolysaccharide heptosyltransferase II [Marinospirillum sp.]|uniref:lipopolysaccharide heptosyltransferase II n=1 Tax=Marinospirillum sp. TaxID=2183934 RepID=UPI003A85ECEB
MSSPRLSASHRLSVDTLGRHLVLLPESVDQLLLALPMLSDLKARYPARPLDIMAPAAMMGLIERLEGIERVWQLPSVQMSWKTFWRAGIDLQSQGYQQAWVLPNQFKPALIPALANIPERTGYRAAFRYALLIDIRLARTDLHPHFSDRYRALAWDIGEPLPTPRWPSWKPNSPAQQALIKKWGLDPQRPLVLLAPQQAGWTAATPQAEHLALLKKVQEEGAQLVCIASRHHRLAAETWQAQLNHACLNLAGELSWLEVLDLTAMAQAVMADDGPLALLALALARPTLLLSQAPAPQSAAALGAACWLGADETKVWLSQVLAEV